MLKLLLLFLSFQAMAATPESRSEGVVVLTELEQLPARLVKLHLASIDEGHCMKLEEQMESLDAYTWVSDQYVSFYIVPCALWSANQTWKVYAEFNEPHDDGHGMFRRLQVSAFDAKGKMIGTDVVHDWVWNNEDKTLATAFYNDGRPDCGTLHKYAWDDGELKFTLKRARVKTKCDGGSNWPEVVIPQGE